MGNRIGRSTTVIAAGLLTLASVAIAASTHAGPDCVVPPLWNDLETRARLDRAAPPDHGVRPRAIPPSTGTIHLLVILAEFSDKPHRIAPSRFVNLLFGSSAPGLADYYDEVSGGQLSLTGDVIGWVPLPRNQFFYSQNLGGVGLYPNNGQKLAEDAVLAAVGTAGLDLDDYDADGDGIVDALLVIHSGQGFEWSAVTGPNALSPEPDPGAINSHKWVVRENTLQAGGPLVQDYFTCPELQLVRSAVAPAWSDSITTIGVVAHEFGHILGLPDLYDTQTLANHVGVWDLMDYGTWTRADATSEPPGATPAHLSAWSKMYLGWTDALLAAPAVGEKITLPVTLQSASAGGAPLQALPNAFGIDWRPGRTGTGEYFLAEVRTRQGYDLGLPGEGLLLYHVDESRANNSGFDNPDAGRLLALEPRDGETSIFPPNQIVSEAWPGGGESRFDEESDPSSDLHDGKVSGVTLSNIGALGGGGSIALVASIENLSAEVPAPLARPNPWNPNSDDDVRIVLSLGTEIPTGGQVVLYDIRGRRVRALPTSGFESDGRIAIWDGLTDDGRPAVAGVYFFRLDGTATPQGAGRLTLVRR